MLNYAVFNVVAIYKNYLFYNCVNAQPYREITTRNVKS